MEGFDKRITIICGHYGSGKTNLAVNLAVREKRRGRDITLVDLDIVNPYFRSSDFSEILNKNGISTINPMFANSNLDIPALTADINGIFEQKSRTAVIDVGGDDAGAAALGRYARLFLDENNYSFLYVINRYRYLTQTPADAVEIMREIERTSRMKVTGIINNSNLGQKTTADTITSSVSYGDEVAALAGVPLLASCCDKALYSAVLAAGGVPLAYPVDIYVKPPWEDKTDIQIQ